jgi:hypothetical protein
MIQIFVVTSLKHEHSKAVRENLTGKGSDVRFYRHET